MWSLASEIHEIQEQPQAFYLNLPQQHCGPIDLQVGGLGPARRRSTVLTLCLQDLCTHFSPLPQPGCPSHIHTHSLSLTLTCARTHTQWQNTSSPTVTNAFCLGSPPTFVTAGRGIQAESFPKSVAAHYLQPPPGSLGGRAADKGPVARHFQVYMWGGNKG